MWGAFEHFYKQRLDFVIERSLNEIELKAFLDHIVKHDEGIRFTELSDMIRTIFKEASTELIVHQRASMANINTIKASMENVVHLRCVGVSLNSFNCLKCKKALDEEMKDARKRKEIIQLARRKGTLISG